MIDDPIQFPEEGEDNAGKPAEGPVVEFSGSEDATDTGDIGGGIPEFMEMGAAGAPSTKDEDEDIEAALQSARPAWEASIENDLRASGWRPPPLGDNPYADKKGGNNKTDYQAEFPTAQNTDPVTVAATGTSTPQEYSFELEFDKINDDGSLSIIVNYGEINFVPPDDMTIGEVFTFDIFTPGTEIWARIVFDFDTLAITSRTLEFGTTIPNSSVVLDGEITLIVPIGFVDWEVGPPPTHTPSNITPHNRLCGDISINPLFGAVNGAAGVYFLRQYDDPLEIPES